MVNRGVLAETMPRGVQFSGRSFERVGLGRFHLLVTQPLPIGHALLKLRSPYVHFELRSCAFLQNSLARCLPKSGHVRNWTASAAFLKWIYAVSA